MSTPHTSGNDGRPMPTPGDLARSVPATEASADLPDTDAVTTTIVDEVRALLSEVDQITEAVGDEFDLVALARQTVLLEQAHEALTTALDEVDRR